jgi:hypothetical protein
MELSMKNSLFLKGTKIWLLAAAAITLIACNTASYKTWIETSLRSPLIRAIELDFAAKQSEDRAFGTDTGDKASIPEPAKPDINAVSGVGEILTEEWVVNVFEGIVTDFKQPPYICNANYFDFPANNCAISYSAEKIVPYQNTLSIPEAGS